MKRILRAAELKVGDIFVIRGWYAGDVGGNGYEVLEATPEGALSIACKNNTVAFSGYRYIFTDDCFRRIECHIDHTAIFNKDLKELLD